MIPAAAAASEHEPSDHDEPQTTGRKRAKQAPQTRRVQPCRPKACTVEQMELIIAGLRAELDEKNKRIEEKDRRIAALKGAGQRPTQACILTGYHGKSEIMPA